MTEPCLHCGRKSKPLFLAKDWNRRITEARFAYHRCPGCGLVFLRPVPENLGDYYPPDYYPVPGSLAELETASTNERFKLDLITPFVRSGRLLEVGPAFGNFAYLAKRSGFEVEVVEMDARCCGFLREVAGVTAIHSDDAARAVEDRAPYDVVALWHVIEHLPDFGPVLAALARKVKPGGILVLAAPNPEALQFRLLGRRWTHVDAPRHVALIPVRLLASHLTGCGFSVAAVTMTDPGGVGWNQFGWQMSLANFARGRALRGALLRVGALLSRVMAPLERNDRRGSAYTVVFRKDA